MFDAPDDCSLAEPSIDHFDDGFVGKRRRPFQFRQSASLGLGAQDTDGGAARGYAIPFIRAALAAAACLAFRTATGAENVSALVALWSSFASRTDAFTS